MTALESVVDNVGAKGLDQLWRPGSVAVVGASDDPAKWGHWLASGALSGRELRRVHLVNHNGTRVCGTPTVRSLREVGGPVDLAVIAVPVPAVADAVDAALDTGARALLVITDGLHRLPRRPDLADELAERARAAGVRLVGPSSLGIADTAARLQLAWGRFVQGPVAVVTQSGQVGSELAAMLARHGSGVSRFASVGRQVDVTTEELLASLVTDEPTRAVLTYLEDVRDPRAFLEAATALRAAGKPLVVLAAGTSAAGSAAARSHTGALTGSIDVLDAACRAAGAVRAGTPAHAAALAHALALGTRPQGRRIAVISDSGGQAALAADVAATAGLTVAPLDAEAGERVRTLLPDAAQSNPIDLAGAGEQDMTVYARAAEAVADSVDAVLLTGYFGRFGEDSPSLADAERLVAERLTRLTTKVPVLVHSMADEPITTGTLTGGGVPVFADVRTTLLALAGSAEWTGARPRALPPVPAATPPPGGDASYLAAREVLMRAGVPMADAATANSAAEAVEISRRWPGRTVLKVAELAHKTEVGGVVLGLRTEEEVAAAYRELTHRLAVPSLVVERMDERPGVVEMLVGVRRDPVFGPVIVVGTGGVTAELWRDTALELAPVTEEQAARMLTRLRGYPLLLGWRGAPGTDLAALARCVAAVSRIPRAEPHVAACEINPLRVAPDGVVAVDALLTWNGMTEEMYR
ncbi:acetate--CoA ligase family protein [Amycolatopsis palatopharyngis]|uniref:acetate--CoA ligase family protein n=1 Tax=Amycolatopsis palatopharyngis TaxID=187982 RepID=UPI000E256133|nr:acetate--CoA ligase family protein [Amycolatopsis palatopharyngis]